MAPKVFTVQLAGKTIPVTVDATRHYPTGGGVYVQLNSPDEQFGPVFDVMSVDLSYYGAPPPGPGRCYIKTYKEEGREMAAQYERQGIVCVLNWAAVPMPHNKTAALAEVLVKPEDMDTESY